MSKKIIKLIIERLENYKKLHIENKFPGALDKWEAMVELLKTIREDSDRY